MVARKNRLKMTFENYQKNVFSKKGARLTCMWSNYGGWWYITDSSPPPPPAKPAQAKPAPAKPTPAPVVAAKPAQMKPQAMPVPAQPGNAKPPAPSPSRNAAPNPANTGLPPDELLPIEQINIAAKYLPAAGADYEEMMFGESDDDDAHSEDMP